MTTTTTAVVTAPVVPAELAEAELVAAPLLPVETAAPLFVLPLPVTEEELVELPVAPEPVDSEEPPDQKPRLDYVMPPPFLPPPAPPPALKPVGHAAQQAPEPVKVAPPPPAPMPVAAEAAEPVKVAPPVVGEPVVTGTVSAKQVAPMQTMEKTEKVADRAEQILPRGQFVPVAEPVRSELPTPPVVVRRPVSPELPPVVPMPVAVERPVRVEAPAPVEAVRPSPAVEKAFTEISQQAVSFKRVGATTAEVQVRPDRRTEITLHLSVRAGQVEVTAQLERGDFDGLRAHWAGLQESLAQQGVRVGQLMPTAAALDERFAGGQGGSQFRDQPFRQFDREQFEEPLAGGASLTPAPTRRAATPSGRGWERWA